MPFGREEFLLQKGKFGNPSSYDLFMQMEKDGVLDKVLDHTDYKEQEDLF